MRIMKLTFINLEFQIVLFVWDIGIRLYCNDLTGYHDLKNRKNTHKNNAHTTKPHH
jgi:hypothetical protein